MKNIEFDFSICGFDYIKDYFGFGFSVLKLGIVIITWEKK
jgi:hypothetical protein